MARSLPLPLTPLAALALLAGCGPTERPAPIPAPPPAVAAPAVGLDRVMGHDAAGLQALFGAPALDVHEGPARKLQFRSTVCVLDAYLYPPATGGEAKVTWIDARTPTGPDLDRASCIAALARVERPKPKPHR